jgi:lysylphosphatidylglycerol synthetase-like protein (DUF2156 family)
MEPLVFNRNSWHFRLANFGDTRVYGYTDICSYVRSVTIGLCLVLLVAFFSVGFAAWVILSAIDIYNTLMYGIALTESAKALLLFLTATVGLIGFMLLVAGAFVLKERNPDNFVSAAYTKFKTRTCRPVELVDHE